MKVVATFDGSEKAASPRCEWFRELVCTLCFERVS